MSAARNTMPRLIKAVDTTEKPTTLTDVEEALRLAEGQFGKLKKVIRKYQAEIAKKPLHILDNCANKQD